MQLNIHAPSLGIGAAIAAVSILGAFFVLGSDNAVAKIGGAQPYEVFEKIFESQLKK